jgi:hypothetical protein
MLRSRAPTSGRPQRYDVEERQISFQDCLVVCGLGETEVLCWPNMSTCRQRFLVVALLVEEPVTFGFRRALHNLREPVWHQA